MKLRAFITVYLFLFASFSQAENDGDNARTNAYRPDLLASADNGAKTNQPKQKMYKYVVGGVTSFSDQPPMRGSYIVLNLSCYACSLTSSINWRSTKLHLDAFSDAIKFATDKYNVDAALVRAVIHAESGFNARARSRKGAMGLMQLMPATAREVGVVDARIPAHNIRGGVQYLAGLLARFKGNTTLATAAYNAGPNAVEKYRGVPPYAETQAYVERVEILRRRYKSRIDG